MGRTFVTSKPKSSSLLGAILNCFDPSTIAPTYSERNFACQIATYCTSNAPSLIPLFQYGKSMLNEDHDFEMHVMNISTITYGRHRFLPTVIAMMLSRSLSIVTYNEFGDIFVENVHNILNVDDELGIFIVDYYGVYAATCKFFSN